MEYTYYGNSGLRISKLGLGLMKISNTDLENATKIFEHAYKSGINYFDTGEFYGEGKSEIMLGQIIKKFARYTLSKVFYTGHAIPFKEKFGVFWRAVKSDYLKYIGLKSTIVFWVK